MQQPFDYSVDIPKIQTYNKRRRPSSATRIQTQMGPAPFDGDPTTASVVLLMNNPGYYEGSSPLDHQLRFAGWPLAGLHPDAPEHFRRWYFRPFGHLIREYGEHRVSRQVCIIQICPWASKSFDLRLVLPSRERQVTLALKAAERGAAIVVGRSPRFWKPHLSNSHNVVDVRNPRNPTLSPGGLGQDGFAIVKSAMDRSA